MVRKNKYLFKKKFSHVELFMPLKDVDARRAYLKEYTRRRMAEDPEFRAAHLKAVRRHGEKIRILVRSLIAEFRKNGCTLCPETDPVCLSAHHVDPTKKDFNIGEAVRGKIGVRKVQAELAKCICLCNNCHAKVHAGVLVLAF